MNRPCLFLSAVSGELKSAALSLQIFRQASGIARIKPNRASAFSSYYAA